MSPGVTVAQSQAQSQPEVADEWRPLRPNILVTGTPGVGKTSLSAVLAADLGLRHIEVGEFARERNLLADHDALHEAFYMHEDAVLDELEPIMTDGGVILDHHSCDWYPERWFQIVVVLRADTEVLYDRLESREYSRRKIEENLEAEIMQVVFEEAVSSYPRVTVIERRNNIEEDRYLSLQIVKRKWRGLTRAPVEGEVFYQEETASTGNRRTSR